MPHAISGFPSVKGGAARAAKAVKTTASIANKIAPAKMILRDKLREAAIKGGIKGGLIGAGIVGAGVVTHKLITRNKSKPMMLNTH